MQSSSAKTCVLTFQCGILNRSLRHLWTGNLRCQHAKHICRFETRLGVLLRWMLADIDILLFWLKHSETPSFWLWLLASGSTRRWLWVLAVHRLLHSTFWYVYSLVSVVANVVVVFEVAEFRDCKSALGVVPEKHRHSSKHSLFDWLLRELGVFRQFMVSVTPELAAPFQPHEEVVATVMLHSHCCQRCHYAGLAYSSFAHGGQWSHWFLCGRCGVQKLCNDERLAPVSFQVVDNLFALHALSFSIQQPCPVQFAPAHGRHWQVLLRRWFSLVLFFL